ncbi:MAG: hypothetical protein IT425_12425 [Pirellulales bacterium]|nr:hypothetical protein [Pirellulales bacterium]
MKLASNFGMMLLGVWLILLGGLPLLNISLGGWAGLMNLLAVAAGVAILINK